MNNTNTNRRLLFILATVGVWLNVLMFIPFGKTFNQAESIVKFIVLPIVVAILNIVITVNKFADYRPNNRFQSFASYLPMFSYFTAAFTYLIFMTSRAVPTAVFGFYTYLILMICFALIAVAFVGLQLSMDRINLNLTKNQVNIIDVVVYIVFALDLVILRFAILKPYTGIALTNSSAANITVGIIMGIVIMGLLFLRLFIHYQNIDEFVSRNKADLLKEWQQLHDESYTEAELAILYSLHNYANTRFEVKEDQPVVEEYVEGVVKVKDTDLEQLKGKVKQLNNHNHALENKYQKLRDEHMELKNQVEYNLAFAELEGYNKQLDVLNNSINEESKRVGDDIDQYEAEKAAFDEKVTAFEAEKAALLAKLGFESIAQAREKEEADRLAREQRRNEVKVKPEKVFKPSYDEVLGYAKSVEDENVSMVSNPNNTQQKFLYGNKPFLILQKTANYYRVTFCVKYEDIPEYLQGYPGEITVANSPKNGYYLMINNMGELDEELLQKIIREALPAFVYNEEQVALAKAEAKRLADAKKAEAKENARKLREYEKMQARTEKQILRDRLKAEKAAEEAANRIIEEAKKTAESEAAKIIANAISDAAEGEISDTNVSDTNTEDTEEQVAPVEKSSSDEKSSNEEKSSSDDSSNEDSSNGEAA